MRWFVTIIAICVLGILVPVARAYSASSVEAAVQHYSWSQGGDPVPIVNANCSRVAGADDLFLCDLKVKNVWVRNPYTYWVQDVGVQAYTDASGQLAVVFCTDRTPCR